MNLGTMKTLAAATMAAALLGCTAEALDEPGAAAPAALAATPSAHDAVGGGGSGTAAGTGTLDAPATTIVKLFDAPWGKEPGAFAKDDAPEGARPGPLSFAFDGAGRLVVLDTFNGRLQRFDATGKLDGVLLLPPGLSTDLAIAASGDLLVLQTIGGDGAGGELQQIAHLRPDGALAGTWAVAPPLPTGLFVEGDWVLVESKHGAVHRVATLSGGALPFPDQLEPYAVGRPDRSHAGRYWEARKDGDAVRLLANDAYAAVTAKLRVDVPGGLLSLFDLDTDASGNVYAGLYVDERALVAVVAPDGALLGAVAVDPFRWAEARRFVSVRDDGAIVEMRASEAGVSFVEHVWRAR
jgi:hypothetical protein